MLTDLDLSILRERYNARGHNNDWAEKNLGFGFIHYAMIRNLQPEDVLCVGSQRGFIPAICAMACRDNGFGKVTFVDAGLDMNVPDDNKIEGQKSWGGLGIWKTATPEYWHESIRPFIDLKVMTTEQYRKEVGYKMFGYIYLDGDHSYLGVKRDVQLFWHNLPFGAYMTMHDIAVDKQTDWGECGVRKFWLELLQDPSQSVGDSYDKVGISGIELDCGLGVLQRICHT